MCNVIHTKMEDVSYCLMCGKYIGKGHDPALCDNPSCNYWFDIETAFNAMLRDITEEPTSYKPFKHMWE